MALFYTTPICRKTYISQGNYDNTRHCKHQLAHLGNIILDDRRNVYMRALRLNVH